MTTVEPEVLTPAGRRWVERAQGPLDVLAVIFLVDVILIWGFPDGPPAFLKVLNVIAWIVWACFAVDYVARLRLSVGKARFVRTHKLDLLMVLLPMLRLLRVFLVLRRSLASVSTEKIAGSIVSLVVAAVFVSAFFMWRVEYNAPGATITTFRYALWWAIVTTTTVGYGDYTPVTLEGRVIATAVMVVGIGLIGTVSATVAAWFVTRRSDPGTKSADAASVGVEPTAAGTADTQALLLDRLEELAAKQDEIRAMLNRAPAAADHWLMTVSATPPNTSQGWSARYGRQLLVGCLRYQRRTAPTRPTLRPPTHTPFVRLRLLFRRVSADGSFAGGGLPACRVRRRRGVGLQPKHHRDLVLALMKVGGVCRAAEISGAESEVLSEADRASVVGPYPVVQLCVPGLDRQFFRRLDKSPRNARAAGIWDDVQAKDLGRRGVLLVRSEAGDSLRSLASFGQ